MKKENGAFLVSGVSLLISIIAVCMAGYRTPTLGFDYQGILVGILSLLIATLAIFFALSYLTVEKRIKQAFELKMEESFEGFETKTVKGIVGEQHKIIDILRDYFLAKQDLGSYIVILIADLEMGVRIKQQDTIELAVSCLIDVYSEPNLAKTLKVKRHNIDKLFSLLDDLPGRNVHVLLNVLEFVYDRPCGNTPET